MKSKFIKDKERSVYFFTTFIELLLSVGTFHLAVYIREHHFSRAFEFTREYQLLMMVMLFSWYFLLRSGIFDKFQRTKSYSSIFIEYCKGILIATAILAGSIFIFKLNTISRGFILIFAPINLLTLFMFRLAFYRMLKHIRSQGKNQQNVVIIGDDSSESIIERIIRNKEWGLKIVKIITNSRKIVDQYQWTFEVIPEGGDLQKILESDIIDQVIFSKSHIDQKELNQLIHSCEEIGIIFHMYSECWNLTGRKYHLSYFGDMPYFTFMNRPSDYFALYIKSMLDYVMAFVLIVTLSPLMLLIALAIKIDSRGGVIFKQERIGLRGRRFALYKFRSMVAKAEELKVQIAGQNEMDGPVFKIKKDPRITHVGRFLRRTGMDELPQLFNILKGEMSFIGPRPPIWEEVIKYERWQLRRLSMKPGISCIWQTMPNRNEIRFKEWMQMDLQYIDSWNLKLDMQLFVRTFKTVLTGSGR